MLDEAAHWLELDEAFPHNCSELDEAPPHHCSMPLYIYQGEMVRRRLRGTEAGEADKTAEESRRQAPLRQHQRRIKSRA